MEWKAWTERAKAWMRRLGDKTRQVKEETHFGVWAPWAAIAIVWLLFEVPTVFWSGKLRLNILRPSGDVLGLLTLGAASYFVRGGAFLRAALWLVAIVFVVVRIDAAICRVLIGEEPLLYDQIFMIQHAATLVLDLWSPQMLYGVLGVVFGGVVLGFVLRALFRSMRTLLTEDRIATTAKIGLALWVLAIPLSASRAFGFTKRPLVQWQFPSFTDNVRRSRLTYKAVNKAITKPPYEDLDAVKLEERPDVLLLLVESYGRIMATDPSMTEAYHGQLDHMQQALSSVGWNAVTGYSTAPVTGARSWIADGTIMMGTPVRYESVFRHLVENSSKLRTLPSFLAAQGYETMLVVPADRVRPGIEEITNRYGFDRIVHYDTLEYTGKQWGWGIIPDQYSVEFVDEHFLRPAKKPVFLDFHMVSSHAPWKHVPDVVEDYRELQTGDAPPEVEERAPHKLVLVTTKSFRRKDKGRKDYMGRITNTLSRRYAHAVSYCLDVLKRFLEQREENALVIIMGDHQPPLISEHTESYDVPVHVFAREDGLLAEFRDQGFVDGLRPPEEGKAQVGHGGLLTLIARALARSGGQEGAPLPTFRRNGVRIVK